MGKGNKIKVAPYMLFCEEQKKTVPEYFGKSKPELVTLCSPAWSAMTISERQPYVQMAKEFEMGAYAFNTVQDGSMVGRFDSFGRSLLAVKQKEELEEYDRLVMVQDIGRRVRHSDVLKTRFHVMHVNVWCDVDLGTDEFKNKMMPAEIGLVEFTLAGGIEEVYSQKVDPGVPPRACKGDMKIFSEKFHKIGFDHPELCDDYEGILQEMAKMLTAKVGERAAEKNITVDTTDSIRKLVDHRNGSRKPENCNFLPIFVLRKHKRRCVESVNWLLSKTKCEYSFSFFDAHELLFQLLEQAPNDLSFKVFSINMAEAELEKEDQMYQFTSGVLCEYHDKVECPQCSPAISIRQALIILGFCIPTYEIKPIEGLHTPWGVRLEGSSIGGGDDTGLLSMRSADVTHDSTWSIEFEKTRPTVGDASLAARELGYLNVRQHPLHGLIERKFPGSEISLIPFGKLPVKLIELDNTSATHGTEFYTPGGSEAAICNRLEDQHL